MKLHKDFIKKRIHPTIGSPAFLGICTAISSLKENNSQYYGDTLMKIHEKYRYCAWIPMMLFRLGYIQALVDGKQKISFDFTHQDAAVIERGAAALTGQCNLRLITNNHDKEAATNAR